MLRVSRTFRSSGAFAPSSARNSSHLLKRTIVIRASLGWGVRLLRNIRQADRLAHLYAIGKTGIGKSTLLEMLMRSDLRSGTGFALLDPHGDLAEKGTDGRAARTKERL